MAIVTEAECDSCKKREPVSDTFGKGYAPAYPIGWFLLMQMETHEAYAKQAEASALCSWPCVEAFAKLHDPVFRGATVTVIHEPLTGGV